MSAMAISEIVSRLKPRAYINRNVETRQVGIETRTMSVLRQVWRNRNSTTPVRRMASSKSFCTASTAYRTKRDVSFVTVMCTVEGSPRWICCRALRTAAAVWSVFASDCLVITSATLLTPGCSWVL